MSLSEHERTAADRVEPDAPAAPAHLAPAGIRADLEAVWAISAPEGEGAAVAAVLAFAAATLERSVAEGDPEAAANVVAAVVAVAGLAPVAARRVLFRDTSRRLALAGPEPAAALDLQLHLLVLLGPVSAASVWVPGAAGRVQLAASAGPLAATQHCRRAAAEVVFDCADGVVPHGSRVSVHAYPLGRRDGALVVRVPRDGYADALPFLEEFAFSFGAVLERDRLLRATTADERRLEQTYERRLVRTAFDLHDGPLQDVAALGAEIRLLRTQIEDADALRRDVLVGRVDDLTERLCDVDRSLRAITRSLETSTLAERPLVEALEQELESFERRSGATADLSASGRFEELTMSQRIAVVRVVQEALSNAREHGGASHVLITVRATEERLTLEVVDDGQGFDVRTESAAAARRGRLGLVGMHERVRLLGGTLSVESTVGSGTTVSASIPAWRPLAG